jgi:ABC-type glycerol-3-phosphate transport system substrate-binding protein
VELRLERIEHRVGAATHLHALDLELVPRSVTVLLGATQAGKTTLMRIMAGLDAPSAGRVVADGVDVTGRPVRERRVADGCTPLGASVARGGATNSPAAVYALTKYVDWMKKYAPKEATGMTFGEAGPVPAQGQIAQQIFWYTAFTADMTKAGLPVVNADGTPKWRMAPGPNGPYWKQGMQNGYQDVGSWTFFDKHDDNRTAAA